MADNNSVTNSSAKDAPRSSLQATAPVASAGRQKTALLPGRSLMDWIRLTNSGEDLTGMHGQLRSVTPAELAKHNTKEDCWMAIHDRVYDVSRYMEYHPGGVEELLRGAGGDATALFNEVHRWVNYSSMLSRCLVGPLVQPRANVRRRKTIDHQALPSYKTQNFLPPPRPLKAEKPRWDWTEDASTMTLVMTYPEEIPTSDFTSISVLDSLLKVRVFVPPRPYVHNFHVSILSGLEWDGDLPEADGHNVRLTLHKRIPGDAVPTIGQVLRDEWRCLKELSLEYMQCHLVDRTQVTHDSILLTLEWPEGVHMRVPVGHHVRVRAQVEAADEIPGIEMARSYTPVSSSLTEPEEEEEKSGGRLYLMLKIYPDGVITPTLGALEIGDAVAISPPEGSFLVSSSAFTSCDRLLLLAAGTGFTPMVRLLRLFLERPTGVARLLFFNKTEADILWREQLDKLRVRFPERLHLVYVLSAADAGWTGPRGRVSESLLRETVPEAAEAEGRPGSMFAAVCGPDAFTDTAVSLLSSTLQLAEAQIHAFKG